MFLYKLAKIHLKENGQLAQTFHLKKVFLNFFKIEYCLNAMPTIFFFCAVTISLDWLIRMTASLSLVTCSVFPSKVTANFSFVSFNELNPLSPTLLSGQTLRQFISCCQWIVWVCLNMGLVLKGLTSPPLFTLLFSSLYYSKLSYLPIAKNIVSLFDLP